MQSLLNGLLLIIAAAAAAATNLLVYSRLFNQPVQLWGGREGAALGFQIVGVVSGVMAVVFSLQWRQERLEGRMRITAAGLAMTGALTLPAVLVFLRTQLRSLSAIAFLAAPGQWGFAAAQLFATGSDGDHAADTEAYTSTEEVI